MKNKQFVRLHEVRLSSWPFNRWEVRSVEPGVVIPVMRNEGRRLVKQLNAAAEVWLRCTVKARLCNEDELAQRQG